MAETNGHYTQTDAQEDNEHRKDPQEDSEHSDRELIEQDGQDLMEQDGQDLMEQDGQDDFHDDDCDNLPKGAYAGEPEPDAGEPDNGETRAEEDTSLPGDWEEHWDEDQQAHYYFNIFSGESSWDHPSTLSR